MKHSARSLLLACLPAAVPAVAGDGLPDKSGYHLFRRVPAEQLRPLSTDRPDRNESAYSVDPGWFQIEMDLVAFSEDRHNAERNDVIERGLAVMPTNFKVGVLPDVDVQVIVPFYLSVDTKGPEGRIERNNGFGDVFTRVKWNLWGNDGGKTALAVMPFVKWPTAEDNLGNDKVEYGIIVPFAMGLPGDFDLSLMTQVNMERSGDEATWDAVFINTIALGRNLWGPLGAFIEFFSAVPTTGEEWEGTFDAGLTWAVGENLRLDAAVYAGITRPAADWTIFMGLGWRF